MNLVLVRGVNFIPTLLAGKCLRVISICSRQSLILLSDVVEVMAWEKEGYLKQRVRVRRELNLGSWS